MKRIVAIAFAVWTSAASAQAPPFTDSPTSEWFKGLHSKQSYNCCDQSDCKKAESDFRDGQWLARSNATGTWVVILPDQIVQDTVSIFPEAILCESPYGSTNEAGQPIPIVFCFVRPPIGF